MLQRAIAHYRFPLFQRLSEGAFDWSFFCADHDQSFGTGLPAAGLASLRTFPTKNRKLFGPVIYQTGLHLAGMNALVLDLGWPLISNPRYLLEARLRGIATIGWSKGIPQNAQNHSRKTSRLKSLYQRFVLKLCDALIVYGQISRDYFLELGYPAERIFIAQNTIDTVKIARNIPQAIQDRHLLANSLDVRERFVFGYLGALSERKQVDQIIKAFETVCTRRGDALLVIAGGGPQELSLKQQVSQSSCRDQIRIVGRVPEGGELAYFQLFDAYLSFAQGGLGILEAMASERLVVSTPERYPETELLRHNETAILSADFSVDRFSQAMIDAMEDPTRRARIAAQAKAVVLEKATLESMAESMTAAIEYAVQQNA